jgi:fluoride exporter
MAPEDRHDITASQADIDPDLLAPTPWLRRAPHAQPRVLLAIALGGVLGTLARYWISRVVHVEPDSFPWATFTVNGSGAFALGLVLTLMVERWPPSLYVRPFVAIGFLGAYTTFSTFAVEADLLVKNGAVALAGLYVVGSLLAGFVAVYLGIVAGRLWPRARGRAR